MNGAYRQFYYLAQPMPVCFAIAFSVIGGTHRTVTHRRCCSSSWKENEIAVITVHIDQCLHSFILSFHWQKPTMIREHCMLKQNILHIIYFSMIPCYLIVQSRDIFKARSAIAALKQILRRKDIVTVA